MTAIDAVPVVDFAISAETLIGERDHTVPNATAYSNVAALNPPLGEHLMRDVYVAHTGRLAPVMLLRLESGTAIRGGEAFLLTCGGRLAREQIAPALQADAPRLDTVLTTWRPVMRVREECLLLARYGLYAWRHWLAELLPRLVVAEAAYPRRFRYALPAEVLNDTDPNSPATRLRETLFAYGLDPSRILPLQPAMDYECERLHVVTPVWSDHVMHPAVTALMRDRLPPAAPGDPSPQHRHVALLRTGPGRGIANLDAVMNLLRQHGFTSHALGTMPFLDQVRLFQSATLVFATLGSDLTGLLYAPAGVRVISAAPAVCDDRFFYALVLDRAGRYADLRGPVATLHEDVPDRSSFTIDPAQISEALAALGA